MSRAAPRPSSVPLLLTFSLLVLGAPACAKGGTADGLPLLPVEAGIDGGVVDAHVDVAVEDAAPDACVLGTAGYCGSCGTACGTTDAQTTYGCTDATPAGTCTVTCRGEFYDLDGKAENGCEIEDPVVQDSAATARNVPLSGASANVTGIVYSDTRPHEGVPFTRPNGREDWFHVLVPADDAGVGGGFGACLGITSFPADDTFEVCVTDAGGSAFSHCGTTSGGGLQKCIKPGGDAGEYYVRVKKVSGSNTPNAYALFVGH